MPATRHSFSGCSHKGFGAYCHRCKQAESLHIQAKKLREGEKRDKLMTEAQRLNPALTPKIQRTSAEEIALSASS